MTCFIYDHLIPSHVGEDDFLYILFFLVPVD